VRFPLVTLLLGFLLAGCASKPKVHQQGGGAFNPGEQKALLEQQMQEQAVWFRGDVRNQRVAWTEGLTLAQAIVAAQYTWSWDPRLITITRAGEVYSVNPRRLIRGQDNPLLEPGDIVEVRH
jgi:hypothetical protein